MKLFKLSCERSPQLRFCKAVFPCLGERVVGPDAAEPDNFGQRLAEKGRLVFHSPAL